MPYAILRIQKLKTAGAVQAVGMHNERERVTLNANPAVPNRTLIGAPSVPAVAAPVEGSDQVGAVVTAPTAGAEAATPAVDGSAWPAVQGRIAASGARIRKNGVVACEVFMGASPTYFRPSGGEAGTWDRARLDAWVPVAMTWLTTEWGKDNVVQAILHLDEATPHIQAVVVPIDPDSGRMNAARWLNGRKALSAMQDRYAEAMTPLGLERGIRGSQAEHTDIRTWYGHLQAPVVDVPRPAVTAPAATAVMTQGGKDRFARDETGRLVELQADAVSNLTTQARAYRVVDQQRAAHEQTAKRLAQDLATLRSERISREQAWQQERATLQRQVGALEGQVDQMKEHVARFRHLPLATAVGWFDPEDLTDAGVTIGNDAQGRERILAADGRVVGHNAIDLTMLVTGCTTAGLAAAWIEIHQGTKEADQALITSSDLGKRVSEAKTPRARVRDPQDQLRTERLHLAEQRVARRRPTLWSGVQAIFKRSLFQLDRIRQAGGIMYALKDLFAPTTPQPVAYDPMARGANDPVAITLRQIAEREAEEALRTARLAEQQGHRPRR